MQLFNILFLGTWKPIVGTILTAKNGSLVPERFMFPIFTLSLSQSPTLRNLMLQHPEVVARLRQT